MVFLFWFSLFIIFYAYLGYPLTLLLISVFKKNRINYSNDPITPAVSLLISAYNEEEAIEEKILNSLKIYYPKESLEIVVVSDGSDDRTDEIVKRFSNQGVILKSYEGRIGKTECINKTIPSLKGEIIVFSDANSRYDKNAIKELVKHFSNEKVGFVTGCTKYFLKKDDMGLYSISIYSKLENFTKTLESQVSSCVGADGAIFAIRKNLFEPLDRLDINDLVIPFNIIKRGYRGLFDEEATCFEQPAQSLDAEFRRQTRIANRTLSTILRHKKFLNPFLTGLFSFELVSHKLCKLLVPFALLSLFVANVFLVSSNPVYIVTLSGQIAFYLIPWLKNVYRISRWVAMCKSFAVVNLAILYGWIQWVRGDTYEIWETIR